MRVQRHPQPHTIAQTLFSNTSLMKRALWNINRIQKLEPIGGGLFTYKSLSLIAGYSEVCDSLVFALNIHRVNKRLKPLDMTLGTIQWQSTGNACKEGSSQRQAFLQTFCTYFRVKELKWQPHSCMYCP